MRRNHRRLLVRRHRPTGEELIAAGLLMLAGHVDLDELGYWVRVGWERRRGASNPYPDGEG